MGGRAPCENYTRSRILAAAAAWGGGGATLAASSSRASFFSSVLTGQSALLGWPFDIHSELRRPGFNATQTFGLIGLFWGQARRRARSWPFDSGESAFCTIFRAEHAPLPRICYYKGKSLGSDNPGRLNFELHMIMTTITTAELHSNRH